MAIMEIEVSLVDEAGWLFEVGSVIFVMLFAIEYGARVYAAGAEARYAGMRRPIALHDHTLRHGGPRCDGARAACRRPK